MKTSCPRLHSNLGTFSPQPSYLLLLYGMWYVVCGYKGLYFSMTEDRKKLLDRYFPWTYYKRLNFSEYKSSYYLRWKIFGSYCRISGNLTLNPAQQGHSWEAGRHSCGQNNFVILRNFVAFTSSALTTHCISRALTTWSTKKKKMEIPSFLPLYFPLVLGSPQASAICPFKSCLRMKICVERWRNDNCRGN